MQNRYRTLLVAGAFIGALSVLVALAGSYMVSDIVNGLNVWIQVVAAIFLVLGAYLGRHVVIRKSTSSSADAASDVAQSRRRSVGKLPIVLGVGTALVLGQVITGDGGLDVGIGLALIVVGGLMAYLSAGAFTTIKRERLKA